MICSCSPAVRRGFRLCRSTGLTLVLLLGLGAAGAWAQPTIRFANQLQSVVEAHADVPVTLIFSEPAHTFLEIEIHQIAVSATADADYIGGTLWAYADVGAMSAVAYPHIFDDLDPEPAEEFILELQESEIQYTIGSVGTTRITIVDNDGESLDARFEINEDVSLTSDGRIALMAADDVPISVDVVAIDMPPGGGTVYYADSRQSGIQSLTFTDDPRQTLVLTTDTMTPGADPVVIELALLTPSGEKATTGGGVSAGFYSSSVDAYSLHRCMFCLGAYFLQYLEPADCENVESECPGWHCPDKRADAPGGRLTDLDFTTALPLLRQYRDDVLTPSPGGEYYIDLYENRSADVMEALLREPTLFYGFFETWELWEPAIAAQVDGTGDSFVITADMQTALLGLLDDIETHGEADLAQLAADFRTELDLENIAGDTVAQFQDAVDSNPMPVEEIGWGDVKATYRKVR